MDTLENITDFIFKIHGDNIVECERTLSLIIDALNSETINVDGPFGPYPDRLASCTGSVVVVRIRCQSS